MIEGREDHRNWRTRGWILMPLGLFLVLFMGAIAWNLMPMMLEPGVETDGSRFSGTPEQAQLFLGIFALVIAFGAACIVNGGYMIATGRRSRILTAATLAIFAILFAIAWAIRSKWIG